MNIVLEIMSRDNLHDIYEFELNNKEYFETVLPPRPIEYFSYETFCKLMKEFIEEQNKNECLMCIVRNETGMMIGRVNFSSIVDNGIVEAELGYRFCEESKGKGYASEAVKQIIKYGVEHYGIRKISAGTATSNIGSQKVLIRNGFKLISEHNNVMKVQDQFVNGLLFEKIVSD